MNIERTGCVLVLAILLIPVTVSQAVESRVANIADIDGHHGELHVFGMLTEAACRLDMTSLTFRDCLRTKGAVRDTRTGNLTWGNLQPVVTISFVAAADRDYPHLVRVAGVTGLGLQITDSANNDIRLGDRGRPRFVAAGQDSLTYYVTPVRTSGALGIGHYWAVVDFRVNYD
ncbi:type 1 fimbrial protein [Photorhabdus tasmaniensis]